MRGGRHGSCGAAEPERLNNKALFPKNKALILITAVRTETACPAPPAAAALVCYGTDILP